MQYRAVGEHHRDARERDDPRREARFEACIFSSGIREVVCRIVFDDAQRASAPRFEGLGLGQDSPGLAEVGHVDHPTLEAERHPPCRLLDLAPQLPCRRGSVRTRSRGRTERHGRERAAVTGELVPVRVAGTSHRIQGWWLA